MARKFQLHSRGVVDLLNDPGLVADLERRAEQVQAEFVRTAPVDTGTWRDSTTVTTQRNDDRTVARVVSSDPLSFVKEARTRTMTRALDAAADQ